MNNLNSPWLFIACILTVLYASLIFYRLWIHPLARFPGPHLAAATSCYEAYYELLHSGGFAFSQKIRELHAEYGPIVRIGPNELSVDDVRFHDKLYGSQSTVRDRETRYTRSLGTTKGSFSTADHYLHRVAHEPLMKERIRTLCNLIELDTARKPNLETLFAALSFDIFYTCAFGKSLNLFEDLGLAAHYYETVELLVTGYAVLIVKIFPLTIAVARRIPQWILSSLSQSMAQVFDLHMMISSTAQEFVSDAEDKNEAYQKRDFRTSHRPETLFSVIQKSKAPDEEKAASRLAEEGIEMFMASYTPGRILFQAMYCIYSQPTVLRKLRKELDNIRLDRTLIPSMRDLKSLPYYHAVMKEIFRITFPVGSRLPLIAHEELQYNDWVIPAKTPMSMNHRNILFDAMVFPEPEKFKPERWLDTTLPVDERKYLIPFGKGARSCPAKGFATQMIQICLASILQRFDFEFVKSTWEHDMRIRRESLLTSLNLSSESMALKLVKVREVRSPE